MAVHDPRSEVVLWPWGHVLLRLMAGETYSWEPQNDLHAQIGNTSYDSRVLLEVVSLTEAVRALPFDEIRTPTFMMYSKEDTVVDPEATERLYGDITAPKDSVVVRRALDRNMHVLVGDALGPENTLPLARRTTDWLNTF